MTPRRREGRVSSGRGRHAIALMQALVLFESALYSAITPILPHYAHALGASKTAIGVLTAAYSAGLVPGSLLGGWLAARAGVRRTTLAGLLLFALAVGVFGLPEAIAPLDALRFVQGVGSGLIWGGALTWVVAASARERRGAALGGVIGAAVFGTLVGPALGAAATAVGPLPVFAALGGCSLLLGSLVARQGDPGRGARAGGARAFEPGEGPHGARALGGGTLLLGVWLTGLEALTIGVLDTLLPLQLAHLGASGVAIGAIFLLTAAIRTVLSPPIGRLCDRRGAAPPVLAGLLVGAPLLAAIPLAHSLIGVALLALLFLGGPLSAYMIPAATLITDAVERAGGALAFATMLFNLAWGVGQTIGAPAGGALGQATGDIVPYAAMAALMVATLPLARGVLRARPAGARTPAPGGAEGSRDPAAARPSAIRCP
jgi:MFS family permease